MAKAALGIANPKDAIPAIPSDPPALKGLGMPALALAKAMEREQEAPVLPDPPARLGPADDTAEAEARALPETADPAPAAEGPSATETPEATASSPEAREDTAEAAGSEIDLPELPARPDAPAAPAAPEREARDDGPAETADTAPREEAETETPPQLSTVRDDYLVALRVPAQSGVDVRV